MPRSASAAEESFLLDAARRGDLDAFGELVRRHELQVYRVALRMLGSPTDAEDAAQDAFVQAWRSLRSFAGRSSFGTWMYRITTNRCLNMIAALRPTEQLENVHVAGSRHDPAARVQECEQMTALTAAIGALPSEQRAALVLREFEGLTYDEIAEVLQVSLAAVKGRIHRARLTIAEELSEWR